MSAEDRMGIFVITQCINTVCTGQISSFDLYVVPNVQVMRYF